MVKLGGATLIFFLATFMSAPATADGGAPRVSIALGDESAFLDASDFGCATATTYDSPDIPMRAFRDDAGLIHVFLVNHENYAFAGTTLSAVSRPKRDACRHMLAPTADPSEPRRLRNLEWLMSPYTLDGRVVYALVHNEFRGGEYKKFSDVCSHDRMGSTCFWSSITLASSTDGGATFAPNKPFVIAAPLAPFSTRVKHIGPYAQTNIVKNPNDGEFYALVSFARDTTGDATQHPGVCVMQSDNLRDWRFWNGGAFDVEIGDPYTTQHPPASRVCRIVLEEGAVLRSVVYQSSSHVFIAVGAKRGRPMYWTSSNLIDWSAPAPLDDERLAGMEYFSILDPASPSPNFDTVEETPNLYVIRPEIKNGRPVRGKREVVVFGLKITPN